MKRIIDKIKLALALRKSNVTNSSSSNTIIPEHASDMVDSKNEQEAPWFTRESILVRDFMGDPPIVYSSRFEDDPSKVKIRAQDQYGYKGKDSTLEEDEWLPLQEDNTDMSKAIKLVLPKDKTANIVLEDQIFNERFKRMQEQVEDQNEEADFAVKKLLEEGEVLYIYDKEGNRVLIDAPKEEDIEDVEFTEEN